MPPPLSPCLCLLVQAPSEIQMRYINKLVFFVLIACLSAVVVIGMMALVLTALTTHSTIAVLGGAVFGLPMLVLGVSFTEHLLKALYTNLFTKDSVNQ